MRVQHEKGSGSIGDVLQCIHAGNVANAAPHFNDEQRMERGPGHHQAKKAREFHDDHQDQYDKRRMREERGVKRLQQLRWQPGYVMPQHYRSNGYKVEYKDHKLPKPDRKQQWYKVNNDYILGEL